MAKSKLLVVIGMNCAVGRLLGNPKGRDRELAAELLK
jgi:hypothetical protein